MRHAAPLVFFMAFTIALATALALAFAMTLAFALAVVLAFALAMMLLVVVLMVAAATGLAIAFTMPLTLLGVIGHHGERQAQDQGWNGQDGEETGHDVSFDGVLDALPAGNPDFGVGAAASRG